MRDLIIWGVQHLSGSMWFEHVRELETGEWNAVAILIIVFTGIVALANIIHAICYRVREEDVIWFPFVPMTLLYIIINVLLNLAIIVLSFSIGGAIGFGIIGVIWIIILLVVSYQQVIEADDWSDGIFNLNRWIIQYSQSFTEFVRYKKSIKQEYRKYLNIQY